MSANEVPFFTAEESLRLHNASADLAEVAAVAMAVVERIIADRERAAEVRAELLAFAPRFWSRVTVGTKRECWPWNGPTLEFGHGRFDTPAGNTAQRYAWATVNGRLPANDEVIRHKCDNPPCCNPDHLEAVPASARHHVVNVLLLSPDPRPYRPCAQERPCPTNLGKCMCSEEVKAEEKEAGE